jgi:hypothetical protein
MFCSGEGRRRRLLQHSSHTDNHQWGLLRNAHQFLATHRPGLDHDAKQAVLHHLETAGARVVHFVPDHTMLVVGPAEAHAHLTNHTDMLSAVRPVAYLQVRCHRPICSYGSVALPYHAGTFLVLNQLIACPKSITWRYLKSPTTNFHVPINRCINQGTRTIGPCIFSNI